jgi:hypothetical protein
MSYETIINNYILENKELIKNYICKNCCETTNNSCPYYITKGKYKNSVCNRKIFSNGYCKVHSKYTVESKEVSKNTEQECIELSEFEFEGKRYLKTLDNIIYGNSERGYFPIGEYDNEQNIIYFYEN